MRRSDRLTLAAAAAMILLAAGDSAGAERVATASGVVGGGARNDGLVWITLAGSDLRFEALTDTLPAADGLFAAAEESAAKSLDLTVRYDVDSGFIDPATAKATFTIREIRLNGRTIAGAPTDADVRRTAASPAEAALAQALGLADGGEPDDVRRRLDVALADGGLPDAWKGLGLAARASLDEGVGTADRPAGPERDRRLISALADNRAWARLAPDDAGAAKAVADDLRSLGAYDEALAAYASLKAKWPDQDYFVATRLAGVYRVIGQNDRALAVLDDLVTRKGAQNGMRYHYNRGRVLMALNRWEDAAAEFAAGLKDQSDYAWASLMRACALAGAGRPGEALAEQRRGLALLTRDDGEHRATVAGAHDIAYAAQAAARLDQARAAGSARSLPDLCDGYWDYSDRRRDRSPLLAPIGR